MRQITAMQQAEYKGILNEQKLAAVNSMGPLSNLTIPLPAVFVLQEELIVM